MAKQREDNTSDIKKMSQDALLMKMYKMVHNSEKTFTDSMHNIDKKVDNLGLQLTATNEKVDRLPTEEQVMVMFGVHKEDCRRDRKKSDNRHRRPSLPPGDKINLWAYTIGGLLMGGGAVIGWLLDHFIF